MGVDVAAAALGAAPRQYAQIARMWVRSSLAYPTSRVKLLNGHQIAQFRPIGAQLVSSKTWSDLGSHSLASNMVLLTPVRRREGFIDPCKRPRSPTPRE